MAILDTFKKKSAAPAKKAAAAKEKAKEKKATAKAAVASESKEVAPLDAAARIGGGLSLSDVLVRPHVTERATDLSERGVYTFRVHNRATKPQVERAIRTFYKVTPVKIAIMRVHAKMMKNRKTNQIAVKRHAYKKALVYLKKGDTIEIV